LTFYNNYRIEVTYCFPTAKTRSSHSAVHPSGTLLCEIQRETEGAVAPEIQRRTADDMALSNDSSHLVEAQLSFTVGEGVHSGVHKQRTTASRGSRSAPRRNHEALHSSRYDVS